MNDAKTTRKQSKCSAYDNTKKKPVCIRVACNCFCDSWRKVKAESEAERTTTTATKKSIVCWRRRKRQGKKHDKNEREDWRTVGEILINPLSFTHLAQSHGVSHFPAARSLSDLHIFCWKSSCRLLDYKRTFFGVFVLVFLRLFQPVCATLALFRFVSASFTLTTMAVGNTNEGFASVLSPWSISAHRNSSNGYQYTSHMHPWAVLAKKARRLFTIWAQSRRTRISHSLCMC